MPITPVASDEPGYVDLCIATGELFLEFAQVEGTLSAVLRLHLSNLLPKTAADRHDIGIPAAIYGSMRYSALKDSIRRIVTYEGLSQHDLDFLTELFQQIGEIQNLRDVIAHQLIMGHNQATDKWRWAGHTTTKNARKTPIYEVAISSILAASADLIEARYRLGTSQDGPRMYAGGLDRTKISWRYKSAMLEQTLHDAVRPAQAPGPPLQS